MARYPVKSAPETSRLLLDAPALLVDEFLCSRNLSDVLGETIERIALATTEQEGRSERLATALQALSSDRLQHVEAQARRIAALSEPAASHLLLGLAEANLGGMEAEFSSQRDALARSLWCYVRAEHVFANAERAIQLHHYRDHGKLYEAYDLETPVPASAETIDRQCLAEEIAARMHLDEVCTVDAVDLPAEPSAMKAVDDCHRLGGPLLQPKGCRAAHA